MPYYDRLVHDVFSTFWVVLLQAFFDTVVGYRGFAVENLHEHIYRLCKSGYYWLFLNAVAQPGFWLLTLFPRISFLNLMRALSSLIASKAWWISEFIPYSLLCCGAMVVVSSVGSACLPGLFLSGAWGCFLFSTDGWAIYLAFFATVWWSLLAYHVLITRICFLFAYCRLPGYHIGPLVTFAPSLLNWNHAYVGFVAFTFQGLSLSNSREVDYKLSEMNSL